MKRSTRKKMCIVHINNTVRGYLKNQWPTFLPPLPPPRDLDWLFVANSPFSFPRKSSSSLEIKYLILRTSIFPVLKGRPYQFPTFSRLFVKKNYKNEFRSKKRLREVTNKLSENWDRRVVGLSEAVLKQKFACVGNAPYWLFS